MWFVDSLLFQKYIFALGWRPRTVWILFISFHKVSRYINITSKGDILHILLLLPLKPFKYIYFLIKLLQGPLHAPLIFVSTYFYHYRWLTFPVYIRTYASYIYVPMYVCICVCFLMLLAPGQPGLSRRVIKSHSDSDHQLVFFCFCFTFGISVS